MKHFRDYLSEEVTIGALASGDINIERDAIRDEINGILAGISARPCVTPYSSLNKIRKALAYFHIHLPKRVYMEGRHGVEVWEIRQFGDKMGMTDQGEFVKTVPCKYYLFFHYHLIGSMYYLEARIVDEVGLEKRLSAVESLVAEEVDAEMRQKVAKGFAPKEPMHDVDAGEEGTKKAVEVSMRRKDKKLSADKLDETRMPASVIKHKQKLANMTPEEKAKKFAGKSEEQLKSMARRHGYGKDSDVYSKHVKEEQIDELSKDTLRSYVAKRGSQLGSMKYGPDRVRKPLTGRQQKNAVIGIKRAMKEETLDEISTMALKSYKSAAKADRKMSKEVVKKGLDTEGKFKHAAEKRKMGIKLAKKKLDEKLTKGMKVSDVISDFVHSEDPKFKGKSKKERMKMALGAWYGMHPEKSRKE